MSLRNKQPGRPRQTAFSGGFSSRSMGTYSIPRVSSVASITPVTVNKSLLTPLKIDIDPTVQAVRTKEKEQIKSLNNRFASFIDKVRFLEQENRVLDTKWKMLQGQSAPSSDCEPMLKAYISNLQRQLELLTQDKLRLDTENDAMHKHVDDFKTKFEMEFNKRNETENEFVVLKKDVDTGYLSKVELTDKVSDITDEFNFLTALYNTEVRELQESLKETCVVVQMDNSRQLNMDQIVAEVRASYEDIAARSRDEAEAWHQQKFTQMTAEANQYGSELQNTKGEIADLKRIIGRLQQEIEVAKAQRASLDASVEEAEQRGLQAVQDAKQRIRDLEQALQRAKQDMARQVREYQELMNVKLALDIEISTYKKLLEGEEERLGQQSVLSIQTLPAGRTAREREVDLHQQSRRFAPILIKTVETQDRVYCQ